MVPAVAPAAVKKGPPDQKPGSPGPFIGATNGLGDGVDVAVERSGRYTASVCPSTDRRMRQALMPLPPSRGFSGWRPYRGSVRGCGGTHW